MRLPALLVLSTLPASAVCGLPRPVHTYSIVARDPATGEMGAAVQSHWFSVGSLVLWGEAGVGVVATQSFVDPAYGPAGLELLKAGRTAPDALRGLVASDPREGIRQVAMVDAAGNAAAHTGSGCIPEAGHAVGNGYSVQANLMLHPTVCSAMARAFETAQGDLALRMLAALEAAEAEGGDIRGRQSAAILIVRGRATGRPWEDRVMDLRVEDHPDPLVELRRLADLHRGYERMNAGDRALESGRIPQARREYAEADRLLGGNPEAVFWHAVALVNAGLIEESIPLFRQCFVNDTRWATLLRRLPGAGVLKANEEVLDRILIAVPRPGR
ncbi:MAG: DUF1028 domain-containing protein [Bacteroidota bacterium]